MPTPDDDGPILDDLFGRRGPRRIRIAAAAIGIASFAGGCIAG